MNSCRKSIVGYNFQSWLQISEAIFILWKMEDPSLNQNETNAIWRQHDVMLRI